MSIDPLVHNHNYQYGPLRMNNTNILFWLCHTVGGQTFLLDILKHAPQITDELKVEHFSVNVSSSVSQDFKINSLYILCHRNSAELFKNLIHRTQIAKDFKMMHFAKKYQNFVVDEEPLDCYARLKRNDESGTEIIKLLKEKNPFLAMFFDGRDLKDSEAAAQDSLQSNTSAPKPSPSL